MFEPALSLEFVHDRWWLCERSLYPESSVLAGQDRRQLLTPYDSYEDAVKANPEVPIADRYYLDPVVPLNPPEDFDPSYCGESWEEPD